MCSLTLPQEKESPIGITEEKRDVYAIRAAPNMGRHKNPHRAYAAASTFFVAMDRKIDFNKTFC
jgi:hypothetical protein